MSSHNAGEARSSIPVEEPQISDAVVEAALEYFDMFCHSGRERSMRAAISAAILADREEHSACELCDIESPWRELVASLRKQISEFITQNEGLKALMRFEGSEASKEIARLKAELAAAIAERDAAITHSIRNRVEAK
jgi:hypothetical protein